MFVTAPEFPPGNSGGPIEATWFQLSTTILLLCFRRVIPAAPLKRIPPDRAPPAAARFPPGNSGGPIEAIAYSVYDTNFVKEFPPGNSGGPIEADCEKYEAAMVLGCFRRVIPAAPLKHRRPIRCRFLPD